MSILEIENLNKFYGKKHVLKNINLEANIGEIIGLYGPNGSGKTTLLKLIAGLLRPTSGSIKISGGREYRKIKEDISFLPDRNIIPSWMRTEDIKNFYKDFFKDFDEEKFLELLNFFGLSTKGYVRELSKGETEKLLLSLCFSRSAKIYLLDEPLSGIDPSTRDKIVKSLIKYYREDSLVIISTHLIGELENITDRTIFISKGEIVLDKKTESLKEEMKKSVIEVFKDIFQ